MPRAVTVARVTSDFALNGRICYQVVLSCGCRFWEYRPIEVLGRRRGEPATCYADHTRRPESSSTLEFF